MRTSSALIVLILILLTVFAGRAVAEDPIRWSAPMSAYPHPWTPSQPPPAYYNQYGNHYPYPSAWPGYGPAAYPAYGNPSQTWTQQNPQTPPTNPNPQPPRNNFSGNPYVYP
ncbi:MAG: hypothetical protein HY914_19085 [Desulfomonile tiedjei]|nr:hypothetical protein [Desulfomonile tiedjei]